MSNLIPLKKNGIPLIPKNIHWFLCFLGIHKYVWRKPYMSETKYVNDHNQIMYTTYTTAQDAYCTYCNKCKVRKL